MTGKGMGTAGFVIPKPDKTGRPEYYRDRPGIRIPYPLKEGTRLYYNLIGQKYPDHPYTELFLPDSTIHAGMRYVANAAAFYVMAGSEVVKSAAGIVGMRDPSEPEARFALAPSMQNTLRKVVDVERAPLPGQALSAMGVGDQWPRRIHPSLVPLIESTFSTSLAVVGAIEDPFVREAFKAEEEALRDAGKLTGSRYYMLPGAWQFFFDNVGLGEMNRMLLTWEKTPLEETDKRGEMLKWARVIMGAETYETWRHRQAQREEVRQPSQTRKPPK